MTYVLRSTIRAGMRMYSAYAPLLNSRSSHKFCAPRRQKKHFSQGAELADTTRCPTENRDTPSPTATTSPANSCPNTAGGTIIRAWYPRWNTLTSVPQVNATLTRTRRSPLLTVGTATEIGRAHV